MPGNSAPVNSNQARAADNLEAVVKKHLQTTFNKPFHPFSKPLFDKLERQLARNARPLILDTGCGNGDSTMWLAERYARHTLIGIDQSRHRLRKYLKDDDIYTRDNVVLVRAELVDFWRLVAEAKWPVEKQYLFYPNPWPKPGQLKRRWHGHPVFAAMLKTCPRIELRTNWKVYAEEFRQAIVLAGKTATLKSLKPDTYVSPFERKYAQSGHELYAVRTGD